MNAFLRWLQFPVHEFAIVENEMWRGHFWSGRFMKRRCKHCARTDSKLSGFSWLHDSGPLSCTIENPNVERVERHAESDLMNHALNISGMTTGGTFRPDDIKPGAPIKLVQWDGCMATERNEIDEGRVMRHAPGPHDRGRYPGIIVAWSKRGQRWEPLDYVRGVAGKWEVWK